MNTVPRSGRWPSLVVAEPQVGAPVVVDLHDEVQIGVLAAKQVPLRQTTGPALFQRRRPAVNTTCGNACRTSWLSIRAAETSAVSLSAEGQRRTLQNRAKRPATITVSVDSAVAAAGLDGRLDRDGIQVLDDADGRDPRGRDCRERR